jgi:hypothetical protein
VIVISSETGAHATHTSDASRWKVALIGALFACASLWDFYIGEVRIFDFIGLTLLLITIPCIAIIGKDSPQIERQAVATSIIVFAFVFVFVAIGIHSNPENLKPSIGMLLGVLVLAVVRCLTVDETVIDRSINWVAWIHLFAFAFQLTFFYTIKEGLNYHAVVGLQPRLYSSVYRPAGLFLEPSIYCFFAASIFLLRRQREQAFQLLDTFLLVSMILSLSLWGISVSLLLLFIFRTRTFVFASIGTVIAALFAVNAIGFSSYPLYRFFAGRIIDLASDPSAQGRYGGTIEWVFSLLSNPTVLFGDGINNFFEENGSNGWAFILNSMGLIGTLFLFVLFALLAHPRRWILFGFAFAILLTAAPLWKTLYFWCWIALMVRQPLTLPRSAQLLTRA